MNIIVYLIRSSFALKFCSNSVYDDVLERTNKEGAIRANYLLGQLEATIKQLDTFKNENIDIVSDIAVDVTNIIKEHDTVDWQNNKTIHNKIAQDIDDMFYALEMIKNYSSGLNEMLNKVKIALSYKPDLARKSEPLQLTPVQMTQYINYQF